MNYIDKLVSKLIKAPLSIIQFNNILKTSDTFFDNIELEKELLISNGLPLYFTDDDVYLKTTKNRLSEQVFCIVDIETTSSNPKNGQIIEIGAIKFKNNTIIETYESLVSASYIPAKVQEITGIDLEMLKNAPNIKSVLEEFKLFLEDDVFIAHNISFDYKFINDSFEKYNLGKLYNRKLCTIELSKRSFYAKRYGLEHLKKQFNIDDCAHHRAFSDAISTAKIFEITLNNIDKQLNTEELIKFSHQAPIKENM